MILADADSAYYAGYNLPVRIALVAVIGAWRVRAMTSRPATPGSWAVTIAFLALGGQVILEAVANHESLSNTGRPFIIASFQLLCLTITLVAICGWFAAAETGTRAWRAVRLVAALGALTMVATFIVGLQVPRGIPLHQWDDPAVLRYHIASQVFWPIVTGLGGYLALRAARRARGPLRVAMSIAVAGQWMLAAVGAGIGAGYALQVRHEMLPSLLSTFLTVGFVTGCCLYVLSFGGVALAHRTKQLASLVRAQRDAWALRRLLRDLEAGAPELTFPSTGWTPLLLRPHAARIRRRVEVRDRLVTLSPRLATALEPDARQDPKQVAAAIARMHRGGGPGAASGAVRPVPILTSGSDGAHLTDLAHAYAQLVRTPETAWS